MAITSILKALHRGMILKNTFARYLVISLFAIQTMVLFQNCSWSGLSGFSSDSLPVSSSNLSSTSYSKSENIPALFGFFADAMEGTGKGNYIRETHSFTNMHFISGELDTISEKMKLVKSLNTSGVLMLEGKIFEWKSVRFQQDPQARLKEVKDRLASDGTLSSVIAIYLIDEPFWVDSFTTPPLGDAAVYANLQKAARMVREQFGDQVLILSSEAYPVLDKHIQFKNWPGFPEEIQLVAVNCYLDFGAPCATDADYLKYNNVLASTFKSGQQLFLTLDNYSTGSKTQTSVQQKLIARTQYQFQMAREKGIKVLVSFLYQTVPGSENLVGAEDLPQVLDYLKQLSGAHLSPENSSHRCLPQSSVLSCGVDGGSQNVAVTVNWTGSLGQLTQSYILPEQFKPLRMQVQWVCEKDGWRFNHPEGWCNLKSANACADQESKLLCTVNGAQREIDVVVRGAGPEGAKTSSYELPSGMTPQRLQVEWTCNRGSWVFSHPQGWCSVSQ